MIATAESVEPVVGAGSSGLLIMAMSPRLTLMERTGAFLLWLLFGGSVSGLLGLGTVLAEQAAGPQAGAERPPVQSEPQRDAQDQGDLASQPEKENSAKPVEASPAASVGARQGSEAGV